MHVLRPVDDDGHVAALARQTGAASARQHRRAELAARRNRLHHVFLRFWNDDADRHLPVVGGVDCIHCFAAGIEAHFAFDLPLQLRFEAREIYRAEAERQSC